MYYVKSISRIALLRLIVVIALLAAVWVAMELLALAPIAQAQAPSLQLPNEGTGAPIQAPLASGMKTGPNGTGAVDDGSPITPSVPPEMQPSAATDLPISMLSTASYSNSIFSGPTPWVANQDTYWKGQAADIKAGNLPAKTDFYPIQIASWTPYQGGSMAYSISVITGLEKGDIVYKKYDQYWTDNWSTNPYTWFNGSQFWILIDDYTHNPGTNRITDWLHYITKEADGTYTLVTGQGVYELTDPPLAIPTLDGYGFRIEESFKVYTGTTLVSPQVSSRGYTYSSAGVNPGGTEIDGPDLQSDQHIGPAPSEVWVDDDWAGSERGDIVGAGYEFFGQAFDVIQDAVYAVAYPGRVNVLGGTFTATNSALAIIERPLTLVGNGESGPDATILEGGAYGAGTDSTGLGNNYPRAMVVQTDTVTIQNLRIANFQGDQSSSWGYGIVARAQSSWGVTSPPIDNLTVENVTFEDVSYGVRAQDVTDTLVQTTTYAIVDGQPDYAVYINTSDNTTVRANQYDRGCIWVTDASNATIGGPNVADGNTVTDGIYNGIWLGQQFAVGTSSTNGLIQNNTVDGAVEGGIVIWNYSGETADNIRILDNHVTGAAGGSDEHGGISIRQGIFNNLVIQGNTSTYNADNQPGLLIQSTPTLNTPTINDNIFSYNPGAGIYVAAVAGSVNMHNNIICNNGTYGVDNATAVTVDATGNWWGHNAPIQSGVDYNGLVTVSSNIERSLIASQQYVDPAGGSVVAATVAYSDGVPLYTLPDGTVVTWTVGSGTPAVPTTTLSDGQSLNLATDDIPPAGMVVSATDCCGSVQDVVLQAGRVQNLDTGEWFMTIQEAIDDTDTLDGHTLYATPGVYSERVVINKELTVQGATYNVNKNGYSVPANYAWDPNVESIITNPDPAVATSQVVDIVDTSNVTLEGFVVQSLNALSGSANDHLVRIYAHTQGIDNVVIRNNVIGPNTNVTSQDGTNGRMGLYLALPNYDDARDITNSLFTGNKIFDCKGNGNNVFVWGGAESYNPAARGDLTGTVIEDNEIYGSHRSGIEIAGSADNLTIRNNEIYSNTGLLTDDPNNLKYGNGVAIIRMGSDKASATGQGSDGLTIGGNKIHHNEKNGVYLGPVNTNHTIDENDIYDNGWDGIRVDLNESYHSGSTPVYNRTANLVANHDNIYDNTGYGAQIVGTPTNGFQLNAKLNWWNAANGPGGVGPGSGDEVSANVLYCPWLDAAYPGGNPTNTGGQVVTNMDTGEVFCTIQEAIDDTDTLDGHILYVAAGIYDENVIIHKGVYLRADQNASIMPASGTAVTLRSGASPNVLTGVGIEGFTLRGTYGIQADGAMWPAEGLRVEDLVVTDCTFDNNTLEGLYIGNGAQVTNTIVTAGIFQNNSNGIGIGGNTTTVAGLSIGASTFMTNTNHGLQILGSAQASDVSIAASIFTSQTHEGINVSGAAQVDQLMVMASQFSGNDIGIGLNNATVNGLTVTDCLIEDSQSHGIYAANGATVNTMALWDNTIQNNRYQGVFWLNSNLSLGQIAGGTIQGNDWGVLLQSSTVTTLNVDGVTIQNNDNGSGFSAASGTVSDLDIENCTFQNNAWEHLDLGVGWIGAVNLSNISVISNTFGTGPWGSVYIDSNATFSPGDVQIHFNDLSGATWGVSNTQTILANAECNWWGSPTGPTHASNPGGSGTESADYVDFSPWSATAAADTCDYAIPTRLVFSIQPADGETGAPLPPPPVVQAQDDEGHLAINFTSMVTITLNPPPACAGATITGTTSVTATHGVVTFTNLLIDTECQGYTLTATADSLQPANSDPFDVETGKTFYYLPFIAKTAVMSTGLMENEAITEPGREDG